MNPLGELEHKFNFIEETLKNPTCEQLLEVHTKLNEILFKNLEVFLPNEHFTFANLERFIDLKRSLLKKQIQYVSSYSNSISDQDRILLYKNIADVWQKVTLGKIPAGEEENFSRRLVHFHADDPIILQAICEKKGSEKNWLIMNAGGTLEGANNTIIKERDIFSTTCTLFGSLNHPLIWRAYEALSYIVRKEPYSPNYRRDVDGLTWSNEVLLKLITATPHPDEFSGDGKYTQGNYYNAFHIYRSIFNFFKASPSGTCSSLSSEAFFYFFREKNINLRIELIEITNGADHNFLLLGRAEGSSIKDPSTWGPDAVICDVWARKIYPAKLLLQCLQNFKGQNLDFTPILTPFDPSHHSLRVILSNLPFLMEKAAMPIPVIENSLIDFLASKDPLEARATVVIQKILQLPLIYTTLLRNEELSVLLSEMLYLVHEKKFLKSEQSEKNLEALKIQFCVLENLNGLNPLNHAFMTRDVITLEKLISSGCPPDELTFLYALEAVENTKNPLFFHLAVNAKSPTLKCFLYNLKNKNFQTKWSILLDVYDQIESTDLRIEIFRYLINTNPDVNFFKSALFHRETQLLQEVIAAGAQPYDEAFFDALYLASTTGNDKLLDCVIKAGAKPDEFIYNYAFNIYVLTRNIKYLELCVEANAKADLNAFTNAYKEIYKYNNSRVLLLAIKAGAKPDKNSFAWAHRVALKYRNTDYLQVAVNMRAIPPKNAYQEAFFTWKLTGDLEFLRLAILAGAKADRNLQNVILSYTENVITKNFSD